MAVSLVVNKIIDKSYSKNIAASNINPLVMSVSEGEKILLRDEKGLPAKDILSLKEQNDLVVLTEDGQEILRVSDYFITNDVDIGTWVNNDFTSYQFADVQTGTITTQLSSEQPSALIYEMLDQGTALNWGMAGLIGGGLAITGIAINNSDDDDDDNQTDHSPDVPIPAPNQPPESDDTVISVEEDASVNGQLTEATDPDEGQTLTYALAEQAANGTAVVKADGSYTYTPHANFNGSDSFTYTIDDGNGGVITHTANITVTAEPSNPTPNTPPTSEDTIISVDEDKSVTGKLSEANDVDGDALTYAIAEQPTNGNVTLEADGSYTYTPNANFNGSDSFTYTIDDGNGGKITQTASVTITAENDAPTATDTSITVVEDKVATGKLSEANDVDGDALTYALAEQATNGSVTVEADGSYTYTPNTDFTGSDSFTYTIDDGNGGVINATANINVYDKYSDNASFSFNSNPSGVVTTNLDAMPFSYATSTKVQSDGKILVAGLSSNESFIYSNDMGPNKEDIILVRYNSDGSIDKSFNPTGLNSGEAGIVITDLGGFENAFSMVVQEDNKILIAGLNNSENNDNNDILLARYNADGSLDTSFNPMGIESGQPGIIITDLENRDDYAQSVIIQEDGKILIAGGTANESSSNILLARYHNNGELDTSFNPSGMGSGKPGIITNDLTKGDAYVNSVAIQEDGKIIIAGVTFDDNSPDILLVRYNTDGSLDTSFNPDGVESGQAGIITKDLANGDEYASSIVIQEDGKILVSGDRLNKDSGVYEIFLARYNQDGTIDNTYNSSGMDGTQPGIVTYDLDKSVYIYSMVSQPNGKTLVVGETYSQSDLDYLLARFNSDGSLDSSFNPNGYGNGPSNIIVDGLDGYSEDSALSITTQKEGEIIIAGYSEDDNKSEIVVVRYDSNGNIDNSFDEHEIESYLLGDTIVLNNNDLKVSDTKASREVDYSDSKLVLYRNGLSQDADIYSGSDNLQLSTSGEVIVSDIVIGSYSRPSAQNIEYGLEITFNDNATEAMVNETIASIAYHNDSIEMNQDVTFSWEYKSKYGYEDEYHQTIKIIHNPLEHILVDEESNSAYHFILSTENTEGYYFYDEGFDQGVNSTSDLLSHNTIDSLLNNGLDTTDEQRDIQLGDKLVQLPTIDELTDLYNNTSLFEQAINNHSQDIYWSSSVGTSGNSDTHMALNVVTGQILELNDITPAEAIFTII